MEYHIENPKHQVFVADGAAWIWNWIEDTRADSIQIVDFFYAKQHLCEFTNGYFKEKQQATK